MIVLAVVVREQYLQVEWAAAGAVPVVWWRVAQVAGLVGGPLFFLAAGAALRDHPRSRTAECLSWYAASVGISLLALHRYGPVYGLPAVRDLPELLHLLA